MGCLSPNLDRVLTYVKVAVGGVFSQPHGGHQMYLPKFGANLMSQLTTINDDSNDLRGGEFVGILQLRNGEGVPTQKTLKLK